MHHSWYIQFVWFDHIPKLKDISAAFIEVKKKKMKKKKKEAVASAIWAFLLLKNDNSELIIKISD